MEKLSSSKNESSKPPHKARRLGIRFTRDSKTVEHGSDFSCKEKESIDHQSNRGRPKEEWQETNDHRHALCEQLHEDPEVQIRRFENSDQSFGTQGLDDQDRSSRRVFSCSHPSTTQKILRIYLDGKNIPVQCPPVRTRDFSTMFHQVSSPNGSIPQRNGVESRFVRRRLHIFYEKPGPSPSSENRGHIRSIWPQNQHTEIIPQPFTETRIPGYDLGFKKDADSSSQEQNTQCNQGSSVCKEETLERRTHNEKKLSEVRGASNFDLTSCSPSKTYASFHLQGHVLNEIVEQSDYSLTGAVSGSRLVDQQPDELERQVHSVERSRDSSVRRRLAIRLGRNMRGTRSSGILAAERSETPFKPEGITSCNEGNTFIPGLTQREESSNSFRQYNYSLPHQSNGWENDAIESHQQNTSIVNHQEQNRIVCYTHPGNSQFKGGRIVQNAGQIRLDAQSSDIPATRPTVWTPYSGQVCHRHQCSDSEIQFPSEVPGIGGGECIHSRLVQGQQLDQPSIFSVTSCHQQNNTTTSNGDSHSAHLESSALVPEIVSNIPSSSYTSQLNLNVPSRIQGQRRTGQESELDGCSVQGIWENLAQGWSDEAISFLRAAFKQNTLSKYDALLVNCAAFCQRRNETFPPTKSNIIADWFCELTLRYTRPEPALKQASAALSAININGDIPIHDPLLQRLRKGIINVRTTQPMKSGALFDIPQLLDYIRRSFASPSDLKAIRDKAMVLLALVTMARPSDLTHIQLQHVSFSEEALTIELFGIKNDYNKRSIKKTVSPCSDPVICPVKSLTIWTQEAKQSKLIKDQQSYIFMKLNHTDGPLQSDTISNILKKFILESGGPANCTGKSVRTSAATYAAKCGLSPLQIMNMGGWKDLFVLAHHYIQESDCVRDSTNILFNTSVRQSSSDQRTSSLQQLSSSVVSTIDDQQPIDIIFLNEEGDDQDLLLPP